MIARIPNLNSILKRHDIHSKFWPEFRALLEEGKRPGKELRSRLQCVANYKAALNEGMDVLSAPLGRKFAPAKCESPSHEDAVTVASGRHAV